MINKEILRKIDFVVLDLDGTLLNDNSGIGSETIDLVGKLKKLGVRFTIASGRLPNAIEEYLKILGLELPAIALDGTYISAGNGIGTLYTSAVPAKYVNRAIKLASKNKLKIALCHRSEIYHTGEDSVIAKLLEKPGANFKQVDSLNDYLNDTLEIVITGDFQQSIKHVANKMSFPYTFGIMPAFYKSHSHGGIYYLEIRKMGSSKGKGLKRLLSKLNIDIENTAVIGDWYNDVSLFETGALKVAVANAVPELKRAADIVTKRTNNEDAVAEFLSILLNAKAE